MSTTMPTPIRLKDIYEDWPLSKSVDMGFGHLESQLENFAIDVDVDYQREHVWTPWQQSAFVGHCLSDGNEIACPWCGYMHGDLWDYDWSGGRECIEVECHDCEQPFTLTRIPSVTYTATPLPKKDPT